MYDVSNIHFFINHAFDLRYVQNGTLMRFKFVMITITRCPHWWKTPKYIQFCQIWSNMKMSVNPAKHEVLLKQYLRSILDISVRSIQKPRRKSFAVPPLYLSVITELNILLESLVCMTFSIFLSLFFSRHGREFAIFVAKTQLDFSSEH